MNFKPYFNELVVILLQAVGLQPMKRLVPVRVRVTDRGDGRVHR
jgi:hypothetical protein